MKHLYCCSGYLFNTLWPFSQSEMSVFCGDSRGIELWSSFLVKLYPVDWVSLGVSAVSQCDHRFRVWVRSHEGKTHRQRDASQTPVVVCRHTCAVFDVLTQHCQSSTLITFTTQISKSSACTSAELQFELPNGGSDDPDCRVKVSVCSHSRVPVFVVHSCPASC